MIHVTQRESGQWTVWTDTEEGFQDGRCLAVADTEAQALYEARKELQAELDAVNERAGGWR